MQFATVRHRSNSFSPCVPTGAVHQSIYRFCFRLTSRHGSTDEQPVSTGADRLKKFCERYPMNRAPPKHPQPHLLDRSANVCQSCAKGWSWLVSNSPARSCQVVEVLQKKLSVTAEVASSSLVVPAIHSKKSCTNFAATNEGTKGHVFARFCTPFRQLEPFSRAGLSPVRPERWCAVALQPHCDGIHQVACPELA